MNYATFLSYIFLTAFTPGPNNITAMSNAAKYGFKKGFRFNIGVLFGFLMMMTICAVSTSLMYDFIPQVEPIMLFVGAAYILRLAWTIWRDNPHDTKKRVIETNSIVSGMVLQFVNVKVILYGITAISTFVLPHYKGFRAVFPFVLLLSVVGFAGNCCWAAFGTVFENFFSGHGKTMNLLMALLLAYCAVSQLSGLF